jgi:hypothetical protein
MQAVLLSLFTRFREKEIAMAVEVKELPGSDVVEVHLQGKLTPADYEHFVPIVERKIQESGKLHLLVLLHDFHGWELAALWSDIAKLAIVGESKWEKGMAAFCKPFTLAKIKYFDISQVDEARDWVV